MEMNPSVAPCAMVAGERVVICKGQWVDVCVPLPPDYPFLIALRNRAEIRRWFLDARVLDPVQATEWLVAHSGGLDDVLLLIRHRDRNTNIGSIGWTHLNSAIRSVEVGRLAMDPMVLFKLAHDGESLSVLRRLAFDACIAVRDYVFIHFGLEVLRTCHKPGNRPSVAVTRACGLVPVPAPVTEGLATELIWMQITRERWVEIHANTR